MYDELWTLLAALRANTERNSVSHAADIQQSKIPRGQQKLLLKALQKGPFSPNTSAAHGNGSEEGPSGEGSGVRGISFGGRDEESSGRGKGSGGRGEDPAREAKQRRYSMDATRGPQAMTFTLG